MIHILMGYNPFLDCIDLNISPSDGYALKENATIWGIQLKKDNHTPHLSGKMNREAVADLRNYLNDILKES